MVPCTIPLITEASTLEAVTATLQSFNLPVLWMPLIHCTQKYPGRQAPFLSSPLQYFIQNGRISTLSSEKEVSAVPLSFIKTYRLGNSLLRRETLKPPYPISPQHCGVIAPARIFPFCFVRPIRPEVKNWYDYTGWQ